MMDEKARAAGIDWAQKTDLYFCLCKCLPKEEVPKEKVR